MIITAAKKANERATIPFTQINDTIGAETKIIKSEIFVIE